MRFKADRAELAQAVAAVAQGLPIRPSNPVHLGMLVNADLHLVGVAASDGDTTFQQVISTDIEEEGTFVFPRILPDMVKSLAGNQVEVTAEGNMGTVACGRSKFTFPVQPGKEYPFPLLDIPLLGAVNGEEFRRALKVVLPATDANNPLPALTSVLLKIGAVGDLQLVATDKYTLAYSECDLDLADRDFGDRMILLPARHAEKIARMDGEHMMIGWDDNRIQVRSGSFTITCRSIQGEFPKQWDMILSMGEDWFPLPEGLADAVKRAALTLGDKEALQLEFGQELTISTSASKGGFAETLSLAYNGEPCSLHTWPRMLLDALQWCDEVSVQPGRPLVFRGGDIRYLIQVKRADG